MKAFAATAFIQAPPERIWSILTDAARYPVWNPTVLRIEGRIASGERIALHVRLSPGRAFLVTVSAFDPPRRMVWRGGLPLGLFVGERVFALEPGSNGGVEFSMRETFTGLLAPLIGRTLPDMQPAFDEFARALKQEAEQ
jgi:hypothetical protein